MAAADAAAICATVLSGELVTALRERIRVLNFEARDMQTVNVALRAEMDALETQIKVVEAERDHYEGEMHLARAFSEHDAKEVAELANEVTGLAKENAGLWHEVVGHFIEDSKRRRLK